jgi:uncharacterized membrane protein
VKKLAGYFLKGLLVLVPIVVTCYVVYVVFMKVDGIIKFRIPGIGKTIPGVGFMTTLILVTLVGVLASRLFTRTLLAYIDRLFRRLPFIKLLYNTVKDLGDALMGEKKMFDKPVMVSLIPGSSARLLGFVTQEKVDIGGLDGHVAVYLPQAYNLGGNLVMLPKEQVTPISKDSSEVMAFIVSAGVAGKTEKA